MNLKSFNAKKFFSKFRIPERKEFRTISAKSQHDWKLIVISFFILSFVAIAGNVYLFLEINSGGLFVSSTITATSSEVVSKKNLEDTVSFFNNRQARLDDLKKNKPNFPDPSL
jgi:hypothetical protein